MASYRKLENLTPRRAGKTVRGVSFPVIIQNGAYFLSDLFIYEDAVVDCWECVDLEMFRHKVSIGWVIPEIPDGAALAAHHLAHMTVRNATWSMSAADLVERVEAIVDELNPAFFDPQGEQEQTAGQSGSTGLMDRLRLSEATHKVAAGDSMPPHPVPGVAKWAFWRQDETVQVATVSLFEDDTIRITGAGSPEFMTLDDLRKDARLSAATNGDRIQIPGLCSFEASDVEFTVPRKDFLAELEIDRDAAVGRKTAIEQTVEAFEKYQESPTSKNLERLQAAYESVPGHMRRYCGDMDTKDIPIRMALYGDSEIENWSHFALAKSTGKELPSIKVPKPKDP